MISPLKLELTNFCQYRKTSIDFHPGITGYVGHNGVGKTNLIDTGLFFAITGETGAFNKDELIRHGSEKGHTCFTFEHNGLTYTLTRNLRSSGVKLEWQSSPQEKPQEEKKPAIINQMVEEMVGMPSEIMREVCWGAQEGLVAVLKMTHSKRLEFFQRLCNVTKTEAWRSVLQERMSKLPVYEDRSIELSSLCQQLSELNIKQLNDFCK